MDGTYVCASVKIDCPIDFKLGRMIPVSIGPNVKSIVTLESLTKSLSIFLFKYYTSSFYVTIRPQYISKLAL